MDYEQTKPCAECPFLKKFRHGFTTKQLEGFARGEFACHKTCEITETDEEGAVFTPTKESHHCAGALIYLEKRNRPHQMMRIAERLGMYDRTKLDMDADIR
jgi:hypothetical protein